MNIIVCIKQIPSSLNNLDLVKNTLNRESGTGETNPYDLHALETGLRIKEQDENGTVIAVSMGVKSVQTLLKEAVALGADRGILLHDKCFAGSDTLATAYTLSCLVKKIGEYDLIICGKQSLDGATAQVGPELAEMLNIPHITNVASIEDIKENYLVCKKVIQDGLETVKTKLPVLITVGKEVNIPRVASLKDIMRAAQTPIEVYGADDIEADKKRCGMRGSPTKVTKIHRPIYDTNCRMIQGTLQEQIAALTDILIKSTD